MALLTGEESINIPPTNVATNEKKPKLLSVNTLESKSLSNCVNNTHIPAVYAVPAAKGKTLFKISHDIKYIL
ncbi:hypothetical protein MZ16F92_43210 [Escherichia coli]